MHFSKTHTDRHDSIYFMNTPIEFNQSTQLLGVHLANEISNKSIASTVHKFMGKLTAFYMILKMYPVMLKANYYLLIA